jgi:hypothetical protein
MRIGKLKAEPPAEAELGGLMRSGSRRLADAERAELSLESRYLVFQCLQHTIDLPNEQWRVLDQAHRKRNLAEYEGAMDLDEQLVDAMLRVAREVEQRVARLVEQ